jgi:hypothetical protein
MADGRGVGAAMAVVDRCPGIVGRGGHTGSRGLEFGPEETEWG